jgi:hypothetical protein
MAQEVEHLPNNYKTLGQTQYEREKRRKVGEDGEKV